MASPTRARDPQQSKLQKQAIEAAKSAYSRLPHGDAVFRQCVEGKETLTDVLTAVGQKCQSYKKKKSTKFLEKLQKHTTWLQNISGVMDVAVQTQAGIGCPVWAPIKFVLKISNDHSKATKQVLDLLKTITECLPRIEVYEKLQSDKILQVALLDIFTDVVDFSVQVFQFFRRGTLVRLTQIVVGSFDQDIGAVIARLERHARAADQTAVATELLAAADFRKEAEHRQHEELKIQCGMWLKPSDVRNDHLHQVQARLDGTCDWIVSNDVFRNWLEPGSLTIHDRLLVIRGVHGCGKSVLASSIIVKLEKDGQYTLFFAFSSSDGSRKTSENLIRTLLWQLLHKATNKETVDTVQHLRVDGQPSVSELWEAFRYIILSLANPVYCIIDGIDECIDFNHTVFTKIMHIPRMCPNLRIIVLGRPHVIQTHPENLDFGAIDITPTLLNQDIEAFINYEIARSDILALPELRENIFKILKDKSDGMFLWVRLMVDDLRRSSSRSELKERLQNLPRGLEEAYQLVFLRLSQKLDKFELRLAQNIMAFTIVSCRPLRFDELRYTLALHCRSSEAVAQPLEEYLLLQPPQKVLDVSGGLVFVTDGVLRFIHSSVRDFLVRPEDRWVCEPDRAVLDFRVDVTQTHRSFAWLCLDYLRSEKEEKKDVKSDTSLSVQNPRESYPLLGYATVYTFYHINRSGPPCSMTLDKITNVLKSAQSVFWVENFAHFLFEDLTLDSQVDEFVALQERMADAGLDMRFSATFKDNLKETISQTRDSGKYDDPRIEQWEMFLDLAEDGEVGTFSQSTSNEATDTVLEPSPAGLDCQARFSDSKLSSKDPSVTVSRIINLLKGQSSLPVTHQTEILLRLQWSLRKTRVLIDPLKVLFQLILRKASCLPIYVLIAVGEFYKKLEKFQEALEVYNAASKKVEHLDVPRKFFIQELMAGCYWELGLGVEALKCHEKAFSGRETLLGKRDHSTLRSLYSMIQMKKRMGQDTEVLRLCDKMCMEHDFVPELDIRMNTRIQIYRACAFRLVGDHHKEAHMRKCLQATLRLYLESYNKDNGKAWFFQDLYLAYEAMGNYHTTLEYAQLAFEADNKTNGPNHKRTLYAQYVIAIAYEHLGRYHEAKELLEKTYAAQQRVLRTSDPEIRWTKNALDRLTISDDHSSEASSLSSWQTSSTSLRGRSFGSDDDFATLDTSQRQYLTAFNRFHMRWYGAKSPKHEASAFPE